MICEVTDETIAHIKACELATEEDYKRGIREALATGDYERVRRAVNGPRPPLTRNATLEFNTKGAGDDVATGDDGGPGTDGLRRDDGDHQ